MCEQKCESSNNVIFGIIGHNINYSLSPILHNVSANILNIDIKYYIYDIPPDKLNIFMKNFNSYGYGLNITKPYKEVIIKLLPKNCCKKIFSINTIYKKGQTFLAESTDAQGLELGLNKINLSFEYFDNIILLGNGGVCVAILEHLSSLKKFNTCKNKLFILRRNSNKDMFFKKNFTNTLNLSLESFDPQTLATIFKNIKMRKTLCIQATSAPINNEYLDAFVDVFKHFEGVFIELNYAKKSSLYYLGKQMGLTVQDGIPMFIEQARLAQKLWWNTCISYETAYAIIKEHLHQPNIKTS